MKGIKFGDVHSYDDLNLVLSEVSIPPATAKTNFVDIPGGDGSVDLTEALGEVKFEDRGCKFTFTVFPYEDFEEKKRKVSNLLNGKRCRIVVDKDPDYYWLGRCSIDEYTSDKNLHKIVVGAVVAPYKLKHDLTNTFVPLCGKNLIDNEGAEIFFEYKATTQRIASGFRVTWLEGGSSYATIKLFPAKMLVNKTVTLSATIQASDGNVPKIYGAFFNGKSVGHPMALGSFSQTGTRTYKIGEEANQYEYFGLYIYAVNRADATGFVSGETHVDYTNLQLEIGDTATEYEPYTPTTDPQEVILVNGRKSVCPTIVCTGETAVIFDGTSANLTAGTHKILDLRLQEGETTVTVSGTGAVAFIYQEGDL